MDKSSIERLLEDLKNPDENVRERATAELWRIWFEQKGAFGLELLRRAQMFWEGGEIGEIVEIGVQEGQGGQGGQGERETGRRGEFFKQQSTINNQQSTINTPLKRRRSHQQSTMPHAQSKIQNPKSKITQPRPLFSEELEEPMQVQEQGQFLTVY